MVFRFGLWLLVLADISGSVSGSVAVISVNQPPEVTVALGHDAVLPCDFQASPDETITATPVLYWFTDSDDLLKSDGKYAGRVHRLDQNSESENKSIVLKRVQWSDSKKYECKGSFTTRQRVENVRRFYSK
uniref:Ig-like domain-containing protein n=1 Tax=Kryptolebias marmoratus TaxID=37003 RepID=A0A3Q3A3Z3_KRYMA